MAPILMVGMSLALGIGQPAGERHDPYEVTPAAGPWLICVASYTGPKASLLAHELVQEVRAKYNMPAYTFNRGHKERQEQEERIRKLREMCPEGRFRVVRTQKQCAVLIGGYPDMDAARKALNDVKKFQPPAEKLMDSVYVAGPDPNSEGSSVRQAFLNPFVTSFVVRNPSVPFERHNDDKPDPFLKKLNAHESYSLLKSRKPWTLAVKDFRGASTIQPQSAPTSFLDKLIGRNGGDQLSASAMQAHEVARLLRAMQFEAYVLHTRYYSLVTVGSFDTQDDPKLLELQRTLAHMQLQGSGIEFWSRPMPMEVPRP
ncbi:MAG: hypothetical protein ACK4RK_03245 [Gemmataceae bacterium]